MIINIRQNMNQQKYQIIILNSMQVKNIQNYHNK